MASETRKPQSGLKTIKRDWSLPSERSDVELIPWEPSPPQPKRSLTVVERRLKDIQDALAGKPAPKVAVNASSVIGNKRPPPSALSDGTTAKRRSTTLQDTANPAPKPHVLTSSTKWSSTPSHPASRNPLSSSIAAIMTSTDAKPTSKVSDKSATMFLSQEQTQIKKLVEEGHSVFYTGSAGTGKSVLLREIIKSLRRKYVRSSDAVAITASTGIAACNIGGVTIHSFAGIGLGIESAEQLAQKVNRNKKASARWLRTKVLIIDEISMVDGDLFDKLSRVGSSVRKKDAPFGGIQVVVTGDFFQLPPVTKGNAQVKFAFEAAMWNQSIKRTFNLTKVFRQSDQEFVDMLNEMRFGRLSSKSIIKFKSLSREIIYDDGLGATELFPRREDVDRSNSTRLRSLQAQEIIYKSKDAGLIRDLDQRAKILANFMAQETLALRVDAQVMLIKNAEDMSLVNGSVGRIIRFCQADVYNTELDDVPYQEGAKTIGAPTVSQAGGALYPVVEFSVGKLGKRTVLVKPESWKVELPNGEVQASRTQLPLILSWAMSIHKSQGQTLNRVKVDLAKVFEKGQAYVALSRATSLDGLQILNFDPNKVKAHPKVVEWSKTLEVI